MIKFYERTLGILISRFGVMTVDQIFELFNDEDALEIDATLKSHVYEIKKITLPVINKEVEIVLFSKSGKFLMMVNNIVSDDYDPLGGIKFSRLYHELLIVQAYIYFVRKYGRFVDFLTENELKSEGENPADLRVITDENGYIDCEIVVTNHRDQLAEKSDNMWFFTPFSQKKDLIDHMKKTDTILINLCSNAQQTKIYKAELNITERRILEVLNEHGDILTAGAIATLMQKDRGYLVKVLNGLVEKNLLIDCTIQRDKEKPSKLFTQNPDLERSFLQRSFGVMASKLIEKVLPAGWRLVATNRERRMMKFLRPQEIQIAYFQNTDLNEREDLRNYQHYREAARLQDFKSSYISMKTNF